MRIERRYTKPDVSPYALIEFQRTKSEIRNPDGSVVFSLDNIEVPADWSQVAADVLAQKYFRKAGIPARLKRVEENSVPSFLWRSVADEAALARLIGSFHDAHERIFAVREPGQRIELSQWKGRVVIETDKPPLRSEREPSPKRANADAESRRVAYFPELGEVEIPVHLGATLAAGASVAGPALVIEPETTIVVYPGWTAHVSELGNYRMELADA